MASAYADNKALKTTFNWSPISKIWTLFFGAQSVNKNCKKKFTIFNKKLAIIIGLNKKYK